MALMPPFLPRPRGHLFPTQALLHRAPYFFFFVSVELSAKENSSVPKSQLAGRRLPWNVGGGSWSCLRAASRELCREIEQLPFLGKSELHVWERSQSRPASRLRPQFPIISTFSAFSGQDLRWSWLLGARRKRALHLWWADALAEAVTFKVYPIPESGAWG